VARESASLAEALAIVLWLTAVANALILWFLSSLLFESAHQERYGRFQTRRQLMDNMLRHPLSVPSILRRDVVERFRAPFEAVQDEPVERRRSRSWAAFGAYVAVAFVGLPVSIAIVVIVRAVLPGTVTFWVVLTDAILLIAWVRAAAAALASAPRRSAIVGAGVVGSLACLVSAVVSVALWRAGGITL
jgi:hypothetical protein